MSQKDGFPCKKCGNNEWYEGGRCLHCQRLRQKDYYAKNTEKVKENASAWRKKNPDRRKEIMKKYDASHPIPEDRKKRNAAALKIWYKNNPEKRKTYNKNYGNKWAKNHPEQRSANEHKRRALKMKNGGVYTTQEWKQLCDLYDNKCLCCGRSDVKLTVDHVIPISKGGNNTIDNIQPLCQSCNAKKHAKTIDYRRVSAE